MKQAAQHNRQISPVHRTKEQARATYDRLSRWYDLVAGGFEGRYRDAGLGMLAAGKGDAVLEIGVGTGHAVVALAEAVAPAGKVYGVDLSQGMLAASRARLKNARGVEKVFLAQADALQLPFADASFHKIFLSFTLELFDTPEIPLVLQECQRVLQPKGRLCVVAMSRAGRSNWMTSTYEWLHEKYPQYFDCRPIYGQDSLEDAGFHTLRVEAASPLGLPIEMVLCEKP